MKNVDKIQIHQLLTSLGKFSKQCRIDRESEEDRVVILERLMKNMNAIQIRIHELQIQDSPLYAYLRNKQN